MNMNTDETAHDTQDGYCCACGYDVAVMEEKIKEAVALREQEIVEIMNEMKRRGDFINADQMWGWKWGWREALTVLRDTITKKD